MVVGLGQRHDAQVVHPERLVQLRRRGHLPPVDQNAARAVPARIPGQFNRVPAPSLERRFTRNLALRRDRDVEGVVELVLGIERG